MRDITLEDTFYFKFSTRQFSSGASFTLGGTPVVVAYEDGGTVEITAGITLSVDFDGKTGSHLVTVVATAANGFEAGKYYSFELSAGTVDSVSVVGQQVHEITIQKSAAAVDLANATDGLSALKTLIDTVDTVADGIQTDLSNATDGLGAIKADTAAALEDTNELQGDWADGGRLDLLLDATNTVAPDNAAIASIESKVDIIDTNVDDIELAVVGLNDLSLTDQLTESYAADGVAPTLAQALMLIQQMLGDFSISGTTVTVKQLDGATTAATFTLNDGTNPTGQTRAT